MPHSGYFIKTPSFTATSCKFSTSNKKHIYFANFIRALGSELITLFTLVLIKYEEGEVVDLGKLGIRIILKPDGEGGGYLFFPVL